MAAAGEVLRLGVIGTGSVVREIYQYLYFRSLYSPRIRVEAACDTSAAALASFGDSWNIPADRRFADYHEMFRRVPLDAVAVNTPDSAHKEPVIAALQAGLDVVLPKPTADRVADAHAMLEAIRATGRFMGVDFHKREDPVVKEARARVARGEYGILQSSVWHMLDRLMVADPNRKPRFFASPDFAARNSPVTFLTSHMADTFIHITGRRPLEVRSVGYRQKLPSLSPIPVDGYDLVDSTILFEGGSLCHIITGWALPDSADCLTVQSAQLVFSDGMLELWQNHYGYREVTTAGIEERNILFRNFESDQLVTGFGIDSPGRIVDHILRFRRGAMPDAERAALLSPFALGFYTTLVCECAQESLARGSAHDGGVVVGATVDARQRLRECIGDAAENY